MAKSDQFKEEFLALLRKYKVEMSVRENSMGWDSYAEGVDFDLEGEIIDEEYVIYPTIEFGRWEDGK